MGTRQSAASWNRGPPRPLHPAPSVARPGRHRLRPRRLASRVLVAEAYRLWMQHDIRTDDITVIIAFFDRGDGALERLSQMQVQQDEEVESDDDLATRTPPLQRSQDEQMQIKMRRGTQMIPSPSKLPKPTFEDHTTMVNA